MQMYGWKFVCGWLPPTGPIDWVTACFAFLLERRERWSLLWWLFLQRFCYRQVMYYVMIKSVAMALRGPVVGWGKLECKATAEAGL